MSSNFSILDTREAQRKAFQMATNPRRYNMTLKAIAADSCIPLTTLYSYAKGEVTMPLSAFVALMPHLPNEVLDRMIDGTEKHISDDRDTGDHDTLAANCIDFAAELAKAHHPDSPAGVEIADCERAILDAKAQRVKS